MAGRTVATLVASSLLAYETNAAKSMSVATFNTENTGIDGYVKVTNGKLMMNLNFTNVMGPVLNESCLTGLKFHIHEFYSDSDDSLTSCGRTLTGNHWDPWVACGSATDNDYCASDTQSALTNGGCVSGSSVLGDSGYSCSPDTFEENPYACEVGDWNGKYGTVTPDENNIVDVTFYSPYEVNAADLYNLSVVFHCGDSGDRAFCARFEYEEGAEEDDRPEQSDNYNMTAMFDAVSSNSYIKLMTNGDYEISIDPTSLTIPSDCGDNLLLRVYEDWSYDGTSTISSCMDYVGYFYDPTATCAYGSNNQYCNGTQLCSDPDYTYTCDETVFATPYDRFSCAPGDLSGKYGMLPTGATSMLTENDPLQIDLSQLSGRSAVLQCADTYEMVACAGFSAIGDSDMDAIATFSNDNTGIEGYVYVGDGTVEIMLDLTVANESDFTDIPNGAACFDGGLGYHIHTMYDYNDTYDRTSGSGECGPDFTGGHWDPYLACGSATGNSYCGVKGGCVTGSSVLGTDDSYDCSTFSTNPYVCEVGDWSNKYGVAESDNNIISISGSSAFEVSGYDLVMGGYSVVFHCNNGDRAFCAPFVAVDKPDTSVRPTQESTNDDMIAFIGDYNYVLLQADGSYTVSLEAGDYSACTGNIMYRIYESCDANAYFYDPTVTCAGGSGNVACNGTKLCNDGDYSYSCNTDYPFTCAPGDLSGKYGTVPSSEPGATVITGTDDLMIDLGLISGLGLVVQCDDYSIQACAEFEMYTGTLPTEPDTTSDEMTMDSSMAPGDDGDDDKAFAMSVQFGTIMVIVGSFGLMFL